MDRVEVQAQLLISIGKYESAYKDLLKLIRSKDNLLVSNHPLMDSLKYYKLRAKELRAKLRELK